MPFGIQVKNQRGTTIIGDNVIPMMLDSQTVSVNPINRNGNTFYQVPQVAGKLPFFTMTSRINAFHGSTVDNYDNFPVAFPNRYVFNNNSSLGTLTFGYIAIGSLVTYPTSGYGIQVRNGSGQVTYDSRGLLVSSEDTRRMVVGETITINNGKRVCPLVWLFDQPFNGPPTYGRISREGNNVFRANSANSNYNGFACAFIMF